MALPARENPPAYHFTFLRHGESEGNAQKRWQGQTDYPLTPKGRDQARQLAVYWQAQQVTFELAITSPLSRAHETAEILAHTLAFPLETDPLWMERDNGLHAGLAPEEQTPDSEFLHPYHPIGTTGESNWELYLRAGSALNSLIRRPPARYLIVSHGGLLNIVLCAALGIAPQANFQGARFGFGNTAFATLVYRPTTHQWIVLGVNFQGHLSNL